MKLTELEPQFVRRVVAPNVPTMIVDAAGNRSEVLRDQEQIHNVETIAEADGVMFLCPKCFGTNAGPIGTHRVICWTPKVPPDVQPGPGRWDLVGTGYEDLSLRAGSSSVKLLGGCDAHFFVTNGEIT